MKVPTEMELRQAVVDQMTKWIGLSRSAGTHTPILNTYNSQAKLPRGYAIQKKDDYCAATVSAAAIACGLGELYPLEVSCIKIIEIASKMGIWIESDSYIPSPADWILYDWGDDGQGDNLGGPDHVGCVASCDGKNIFTIEGNINGGVVGKRTLKVNGLNIRGFVHPNIDKYVAKLQAIAAEAEKPAEKTPEPDPVPEAKPEKHYYLLSDVDSTYYRPALDELIAAGLLNGKGGEGEGLILDMHEESVRILVIMYRALKAKGLIGEPDADV